MFFCIFVVLPGSEPEMSDNTGSFEMINTIGQQENTEFTTFSGEILKCNNFFKLLARINMTTIELLKS